jgi:hypothetical protein
MFGDTVLQIRHFVTTVDAFILCVLVFCTQVNMMFVMLL